MVIKNFILNLVGRITWFLEQKGEEGVAERSPRTDRDRLFVLLLEG